MPAATRVRRTHPRSTLTRRLGAAAIAAAALGLAGTLTACGATDDTVGATAESRAAASVTVSDAWVKAAESGMTGAFAVLANDGDAEVRLDSVSTDVAGMVELHETVSDGSGGMVMRPKEGGFALKAGGRHELAPGGDHIMLMKLTRALAPGEDVELVLHFDDGSTTTVSALVKDFTGAEEDYNGSSPSAEPSEMDHMSGMESGSDGS